MKHGDWASYIGIITADGKKKLAKTRKQRLARQEKAKRERHDKRVARAAKKADDEDAPADEDARAAKIANDEDALDDELALKVSRRPRPHERARTR